MTGWSQPTLDGASIRSFAISATYRWESGWKGSLDVVQEGTLEVVRMITFSELTTADMATALAIASDQVNVLLGGQD